MTFYTDAEKKALKHDAAVRQEEVRVLADWMAYYADSLRQMLGANPNAYGQWRKQLKATRRDIDLIEKRAKK